MKLLTLCLLLSAVAIPIFSQSFSFGSQHDDGEGEDSSSTAPSNIGTTHAADMSTSSSDSTNKASVASVSPGSSQTSESPGSTGSFSTIKPSTVTTTTTIPTTTTLPQVDVQYADFKRNCSPNGQCVYEYEVPVNSPQYLSEQTFLLNQDKAIYATLAATADDETNGFNAILKDPLAKLDAMAASLDQAQQKLQELTAYLDATQANQKIIRQNLYLANGSLSTLQSDDCYYQQCFKPTPAPLPSTASTTPPPNPCDDPDPQAACPDTCDVDENGIPHCTECGGNLDGYKFCETASNGTMIPCGFGLFVSPFVDSTTLVRSDGAFVSNTTYSWFLNEAAAQIDVAQTIVLSMTSPTVLRITATGDSTTQTITSQRALKGIFNLYSGPYLIELITGNVVDTTSSFVFTLEERS